MMVSCVLQEDCHHTMDVRSAPWGGCASVHNVQQPLEALAEEPGPFIGLL